MFLRGGRGPSDTKVAESKLPSSAVAVIRVLVSGRRLQSWMVECVKERLAEFSHAQCSVNLRCAVRDVEPD